MVAKLNPRYELPGCKYFVEHQLPQLYNGVKTKVVIPKLEQARVETGSGHPGHPGHIFSGSSRV